MAKLVQFVSSSAIPPCMLIMLCVVSSCTSEPTCKVYNYTHVDCTYRNMKTVPRNLPTSATHLDLSYNDIANFPPRCFETLHGLLELTMFIGRDLSIHTDAFKGLPSLRSLEFTGNGYITFGKGALTYLTKLEVLTIRIGNIKDMQQEPFASLSKLSVLKIYGRRPFSNQTMSSLFRGLKSLEELHIYFSSVERATDFPRSTFQDLVNLKVIYLDFWLTKCIPIESFEPLVNIEKITVRQLYEVTGDCRVIFSSFPRLKEVSLMGVVSVDGPSVPTFDLSNANLSIFRINVFWNYSPPRQGQLPLVMNLDKVGLLDIDVGDLTGIQLLEHLFNDTFKAKIEALNLGHRESTEERLNITEMLFRGLANSSLLELDISYNLIDTIEKGSFFWLPQLVTLKMYYCKPSSLPPLAFQGLLKLTTLVLQGNDFEDFHELTEAMLQVSSLRYLDISHNRFSGQIPRNTLANLRSLDTLVLSHNKFYSIHPRAFYHLSSLRVLDLSLNDLQAVPNKAFVTLSSLTSLFLHSNKLDYESTEEHPFQNLSNLTELTLSTLETKYFNLQDVQHLETLRILGSQSAARRVFPRNLQLKYLEILVVDGVTFIRPTEAVILDADVIMLHPHHSLKVLQLANNNFNQINFTSLNVYVNLEELSVPNNKISNIEGTPYKLTKLKILDLSENSIAVFSPDMLTSLPNLAALKIYGNPFDCSCKMKAFREWQMEDDKVLTYSDYDALKQMICASPEGKENLFVNEIELGLECNLAFMISLPLLGVTVLVTVSVALCKRFHWHIRYGYFLMKLKRGGYQRVDKDDQPAEKQYDAFVVYNEHDRDWVMHDLVPHLENIEPPNFKLCIHERDFMGGNDIIQNILDSIENSHKTMLVLSPHFAQSEWCYFEMRMAQSCLFEEKRDIIVMVSLEDIPDDVMPRILRNILLTKTYIKWPRNEMGRRLFWEKLKQELRSDSRVNRVAKV